MTGRIVPFRSKPVMASRAPSPPEPAERPTPFAAPAPGWTARFRQEIMPHLASAYSFARYLSGDPTLAEDITQEAMLKAWRGFDAYRGEAPKAWLLAIVRNAHIDWIRRHRATGLQDEETAEIADPDQLDPETALVARDDADFLRQSIQNLPEPFREALVLRTVEELSYRQIAEVTGVAIGTVMSRLARAREVLGRTLGASGKALAT